MREREDPRQLSTLPVELIFHLGFEKDPRQKEWLIHEELVKLGGIDLYESLPARARVSSDGRRYEIGARDEDIDGLLALARTIDPKVRGLAEVKNFWKDHPKFSVKEEEGWIYIGVNIEPTPIDFEIEFDPLHNAYELAITAAVKNMGFDQMKADGEYGSWMRFTENPGGQRRLLFSTIEDEMMRGQEMEHNNINKEVNAKNLREFPLATNKTILLFAPGTLIRDGEKKDLVNVDVIAHNGGPTVNIGDFNTIRVELPIPDGIDVNSVDDLKKLKQAKLLNSKNEITGEIDVEVKVEDDSFRIASPDGKFDLEVRTPACEDCKIPTWKFPWPQDSEDYDMQRPEFSLYSVNASVGVYRCIITDEKEESKTYCVDCANKLDEKYKKQHTFVIRARAINLARRRLDEKGYDDVEIWEDQAWRTDNGWEFNTILEYDRDGRKITRHTGSPILTDEGIFTANMRPREYIDFRFR